MMNLNGLRKGFRVGAYVTSAASAVLTAFFAYHQSPNVALALACVAFFVVCSLSSDYITIFVRDSIKKKEYGSAVFIALIGLVAFSLNLGSNVGAVGWQRTSEVQSAMKLVNATHDQRDIAKKSDAAVILADRRLKDIEESLKVTEKWSVTASPAGLEAEIKNMQGDRVYKRSKECSNVTLPESRAFCDKLTGLQTRLSDSQVIPTLRKEAEEARKLYTNAVSKAQTAEQIQKPSANFEQAQMFAGLFTVSLKPEGESTEWTLRGVAVFVGVGACLLPMMLSFVGFPGTKEEDETPPALVDARKQLHEMNVRELQLALAELHKKASQPTPTHVQVQAPEPHVVTVKAPEPQVIVLEQQVMETNPNNDNPTVVDLPPRKITFGGDSAFARRVAGIVKKQRAA